VSEADVQTPAGVEAVDAPGDSNRGKLSILMTEASSLSARHTLYALGGKHTIDVIDPAALCQGRFSTAVRRWYRCPSYVKQTLPFLKFVVQRLQNEKYDVLLPTHEQVFLLSRFRDAFSSRVGLALPPFDAMQQLFDKSAFLQLLRELSLPHPDTDIVTTRRELERQWNFPKFIKLAHSTAGRGVHFVEDQDQLSGVIHELECDGALDGRQEILVQEPAVGVQATIQTVFQEGRLVGAHCFEARQLGVGGMSAARRSAVHPIVLEQIARLGSHVGWHGAAFFDYFYDVESGQPQFLEANPRIGETVNAWLSGVNLCEQLVQISTGQRLPTMSLPGPSQVGLRTHSGFMLLLSAALEGSGRAGMLREISRQWRQVGLYENSQDELTRPGDDWLSALPYTWIGLQLLIAPGRAERIVHGAVDNYSLPESASQAIFDLPKETVQQLFNRTA
jgi:hypothetical protein